jgi:hypothetical protein
MLTSYILHLPTDAHPHSLVEHPTSPHTRLSTQHGLQEMREGVHVLGLGLPTTKLFGLQKLSKVAAPDPFQSTSSSIKDGSRKLVGTSALGRPAAAKVGPSKRFTPYGNYGNKCKDCKQVR